MVQMAGQDVEFGVQTANLFALLDDDAPAKPKEAAPKVTKPKPKQAFGGRGNDREQPEKRRDQRQQPARSQRGGGRGRGGGGGGRGRGGGGEARGRAFDRRSGTGRDKSEPKNGHGKGGWGTDKDDAQERPRRNNRDNRGENRGNQKNWREGQNDKAEKVEGDAPVAAEKADDEKAAEKPEGETAAEVEDEEEKEPEVIGYDEFLAQKAAKAAEVDSGSARREAENDESQWEACAEMTVEAEENLYCDAQVKRGKKKAAPKSKGSKKVVNLDEFNSTTRARGRGRGGRGGRGGGYNGGRDNRGPSVRVDDKNQFPSLSSK